MTRYTEPYRFIFVVISQNIDMDGGSSMGVQTARAGNRYQYSLAPPHVGSHIISVECGMPVCGVR